MASTKRPTKIPAFNAKLAAKVDPVLRDHINAITEALDIQLGRRGDPIDRAVTLRELIDAGVVVQTRAPAYTPGNSATGGFAPPQVFPNMSVPPVPTGVTATSGYSLITVFWDYPLYANHSLTEIWRHTSDVLGDATLIGVSSGRSFVDSVGESASYYYWVRHVSDSNVPGPYHDTNGEHATTSTNVASLLSTLSGAITDSQLVSTLKDRIDLIDASSAVSGSVAYQVAAEAAARTAAVNAAASILQSQISALASVAAYNGATSYVVGNQVTDGGLLYQCILATTGNAPPNATYWLLLGAYSSLGAAVADQAAAIVELNNVSAGSGSANALALYGLISTVNDASTGLAATRATLLTDYSTTTTMNSAIASATTSLASTASVTAAIAAAVANYTTTASLVSNYYTKTATDSAIASAVLSLVSSTALSSALGAYVQTTTLTTNYYTKTATDSAISAAVTGLASTSYVTSALGSYVTTTTLTTNYSTTTSMNSAISSAVTGLASTTYVTTQLANYTTTASLTTNYYTKTQADSAIAAATSTFVSAAYVTSALGSYTTTATLSATYYTQASAALVEAQYFIKLNVDGRVSGFGISSDNTTGSEFAILADRFSIVSPYSDVVTAIPFIVQTTTTTIGGVSVPAGIYISDAFIMNGTITNAKIANAAIDDAKISNLSANKITTGTLDTSVLNIDGATLISDGGVLKIGALEAASINTGLITTDKILGAAVNNVVSSEITTVNTLPTNASYETVDSISVLKDIADSIMIVDFQVEATCTGSGNYALYIYIKVDGVIRSRLFAFYMTKSFGSTVQGRAVITGIPAGTNSYQLSCQANVSGAGVSTAQINSSNLIVTEVKR